MGQRYGKLPSELFCKADTFDLMVMDVALTYQKYVNDKHNKDIDPNMYRQEDLQDRLNRARNES